MARGAADVSHGINLFKWALCMRVDVILEFVNGNKTWKLARKIELFSMKIKAEIKEFAQLELTTTMLRRTIHDDGSQIKTSS